MDSSDKFLAYKQFKDSAFGKDLLAWIEGEYARTLEKAVKSPQDEAYGLLKAAYGIMMVKQHIDSMAARKDK